MQPVSAGQTASFVNQARSTGQGLQSLYNNQATQAQGQYNQSYNQANQANANANQANANYYSYLQNLPSNYTSQLGTVGGVLGYNPQATQQASQNSANLAEAYAMAPQAAQQMSNYSGATAGQMTQNLSNMSSNLQGASAQANQLYQNQLGAQQNVIGAVNNLTGQQSTGMGQYAQNSNAIYSNAVGQMQQAGQVMNQIETLQQNQGYATAQQVAAYQNAYSTYILSQAQAAQASSQAKINQLTATQMQNYMNSPSYAAANMGINNPTPGMLTMIQNGYNPQSQAATNRLTDVLAPGR